MSKDDLINNLIKLSEGKLFLLKQLLTLTGQQSKNIGSEHAEKLDDIIKQKQGIITRIDVLDKEFVEKYDLLKKGVVTETLEGLQPDEKEKMKILQSRIADIYSLTEKIQKIDVANVEKLKKNLQSVQNELKKVRIGKKVVKGYSNKNTEGVSIFLDKKQ
ncbi:MAG TPA: flagellar export chaperone FlgN [Anaerovoracaceae bacterium]|nr:flagellar export chaperone FlgN [Anaerovoracaceae bacterium]